MNTADPTPVLQARGPVKRYGHVTAIDGADSLMLFPESMIIAETETPVRTMTVSMAVMQLDLTDGGKTLVRRDSGEGAAAGAMRYTRCAG